MLEFELQKAPTGIDVTGRFDNTCRCELSAQAMEAVSCGQLKLRIFQMGSAASIANVRISVGSSSGSITVIIGADAPQVVIGANTSGNFHFRLWRRSVIKIEENTTSNGLAVVCDMSEVLIGADCLFSDGILLQSADQHGIVDLQSGQIINNRMRKISIGEHVWLGRKSTLLPDISVGNGSIIGAGAIVTKDVPENSVAVGIPAKVVKSKTTWSRFPNVLDSLSRTYIEQFRQQIASH